MTKYSGLPLKIFILMLVAGIACGSSWAQGTYDIFFPQIADGNGYQTTFALTNGNNVEVRGTLSLYQSNGLPLYVTIDRQNNKVFEVVIPANGTLRLQTDGAPQQPIVVRTGWARITADRPLGGVAIYQLIMGGKITAQAGVSSTTTSRGFTIFADSMGFSDTGVAIANPNNYSTAVVMRLLDKFGTEKAKKSLTLGTFNHTARFISEFFSDAPGIADFEGSVVVESQDSIAAVTLRYDNREMDVFTTVPIMADPLIKPVITDILPNAGSVGSTVTISGKNFDLEPSRNKVNFGSISVAASAVTPAGIIATVPPKATTGTLTVSVGTLTSNGMPFFIDPPSFGVIDTPRENSVNTGTITVTGYGLDILPPGVIKVNVLVNGRNVGEAITGIARPDVGAAFPNYPNSANSGYLFRFDSFQVGNGVHQLVVRATNSAGVASDIGTRNIVVDTVREPVILSISPTMIKAGSAAQMLNVSGKNFFSTSKIYFGSSELNTTFNSSQSLTALIPAGLLLTPGSVPVTVRTETLMGSYISQPVVFVVTP